MRQQFLIHQADDMVGVAVQDLDPGPGVTGRFQTSGEELKVEVLDPVPLGHKVALRDIPEGELVIEYGIAIGLATSDIRTGQHVHVHNVKGRRWA
jgi:(2R)-sulfolactate sulfo-lyase subunit alpha